MSRHAIAVAFFLVLAIAVAAQDVDRLKVGLQSDGRIVVPTNQVLSPAGKQVTFPGRPVDLLLADRGRTLVVKNMKSLEFLDPITGTMRQTLVSQVGFSAVGLWEHGDDVLVSDSEDHIRVARKQRDGSYQWAEPIAVKKPARGMPYPTGLAGIGPSEFFVASSRGNSVQRINAVSGHLLEEVAVGVAPFAVVAVQPHRVFVSNWGGTMAKEGDPSESSSGTDVRVDPRTRVANHGTVSVLDSIGGNWKVVKTIEVGLHPSGMKSSPDGRFVFVANANSDTVSVIDAEALALVETINCRPEGRLPFGSGTNALCLSGDGTVLYVANGTNNCVAVVRLGRKCSPAADAPPASQMVGMVPTGWYPGGIVLSPDGTSLIVANVKGHGSLHQGDRPAEKGKASKDHLGSLSFIPIPEAAEMAKHTQTVNANNRFAYSLAGLEKPRPNMAPVPVPVRHGEPSVFEHVIYVIKENRTYDQVFGDIKEGNGDPNLVMFGEDVTPNQHALVRQFTLFDNFYCSGVLSADGHQWCNEAYVTDYLERAFGKFTRSYPYEGSDPLAFASSGFLWDNVLSRKKSFANYGEFVKSKYDKPRKWTDMYEEYKAGRRATAIEVTPNIDSLKPYTRKGYPGFALTTPDVYRAQLFIDDLRDYENRGTFPNLVYLFLPCDHTSGTRPGMPTPKASVADNDLALGMVVDAVSKSKFWPKTCIFVVEDDPQNGFDHVDAHRTVALAISPYTRRKFVDSTCYNQTGMVKTMELILGLPPMNQLDLSATPMTACFMATPDLTPFHHIKNRIPLDQLNPETAKLNGTAKRWAEESLKLDLSEADLIDEDTMNRILWHSVHGNKPYPERFAGKKGNE